MAKARSARGIWIPPLSSIYQLRIALRYIQPAIWRRVLVPDNCLLGDPEHFDLAAVNRCIQPKKRSKLRRIDESARQTK